MAFYEEPCEKNVNCLADEFEGILLAKANY